MNRWLRRIRGAVGMGISWAAGWAVTGVLVGVASVLTPTLPWEAFFKVFDAPLPALAVPGFIGGALFSVVLGIAGRRRRFDELSVPRFAAWGAIGGLMLSAVPDVLLAIGMATRSDAAIGPWQLTAMLSVPLTILSAGSAAVTLWLARRAERAGEGGGHVAGCSMHEVDAASHDLLGPGSADMGEELAPKARGSRVPR